MRKLRRAFGVFTNRLLALSLPKHLQTPFSFTPFLTVYQHSKDPKILYDALRE
jgi:hypothetical protein